MNINDLIFTPLFLILLYLLAFAIRNKVTTLETRKYFIPALSVKIIGALSLGIIYQFYYGGGDTFNYFNQGKIIYEAFFESPISGIKLLLSNGEFNPDLYKYSAKIYWFQSPPEYTIVKLSAFFGIFSFNTYSIIACCFAVVSFTGIWALYITLIKIYPYINKKIAIATLFIPSVFFWGSGITKDAITLGSLGWLFFGFYNLLIKKQKFIPSIISIISTIVLLKSIKIYILLSFIPPVLLWIFLQYNSQIKFKPIRILLFPAFLLLGVAAGISASKYLAEDNARYNFDAVVDHATIASGYHNRISQGTNKEAGQGNSGYNLGDFDGSTQSLLSLGPKAIFIGLFRPFIWEINSPIMILSALESSWILILTIITIKKGGTKILANIGSTPLVLFCIVFSVVFALGTGLTSGNFGNLVRYRIPMLPFFITGIYILNHSQLKKPSKQVANLKRAKIA